VQPRRPKFHATIVLLGGAIALSACGGDGGTGGGGGGTVTGSLEVACSGTGCGAASATQYSGSGVGIWRYRNTTTAEALIDLDISGVSGGKQAVVVFSNGSASPASSLPSPGALATPPAALAATAAAPIPDEDSALDRAEAARLVTHTELRRLDRLLVSELQRGGPGGTAAAAEVAAPTTALATPAVGDTRAWNEIYGNTGSYNTVAKATCPLSTGRNAVFWVDPAATAAGTVTNANIAYFQQIFCGNPGGYADVVAALGDVWGTGAAPFSNIIQDGNPGLLDFNVVFLQVNPPQANWAGYFYAINNYKKTYSAQTAQSNEALVFFIDASQVARNQSYIGSALLHEMTHMVNFYQRGVIRGSPHDIWLEETTAMMTEDFVTPAVSPGRYTTIPSQRVGPYVGSGGAISLMFWDYPVHDNYANGGSLAGLLDRKYGTAIWTGAVTCVAASSWGCLDGLIRGAGGAGFADEFARLGATIFGLVPTPSAPAGYGFPQRTAGIYTLDAIDTMTYAARRPVTATSLGVSFDPGTHTYQVDTVPTGSTRYRRTGVRVPAGTTLMLVIK
jgi:hypothetical protein